MPIIHETDRYSFATHRGGGASITRKSDNASVFFQPGDESSVAIDIVEGVYSQIASCFFDAWCDDYADCFDSHIAYMKGE